MFYLPPPPLLGWHRARLLSVMCLLQKMISCFLLRWQFVVGTLLTIWNRVLTWGRRDPSHNLHCSHLQCEQTLIAQHRSKLMTKWCGKSFCTQTYAHLEESLADIVGVAVDILMVDIEHFCETMRQNGRIPNLVKLRDSICHNSNLNLNWMVDIEHFVEQYEAMWGTSQFG